MQRRQFLILGGLSTAGLLVGSAAYRVNNKWWDQPAAPDFKVLSPHESEIARAIIDALYPGDLRGMPNGNEVHVVHSLDDYLATVGPQKANLLRLLLHAIDELAIVSGLKMTPFHKRPRQERIKILKAWDSSPISARRQAFSALKVILAMGYVEAPQVLAAAGIDYQCGDWT